MAPHIVCETPLSFSPKLTVAKRKEILELKKTMKPLLEKRRRARINDSLNQLKALILPLIGREKSRYSKLEKADILEMTVKFLSDFPPVKSKDAANTYREGYKTCLQRVAALLPKSSLEKDACQKLKDFVQKSMSVTITPTCQNCCAQTSRNFPQMHQKLLSLKSSFSTKLNGQSCTSSAKILIQAQPAAQPIGATVWRPW